MSGHSTHMKYFSTQEGKFHISFQSAMKGLLYCINTNEMPNRFSTVKRAIATVIYSRALRYCSLDIYGYIIEALFCVLVWL